MRNKSKVIKKLYAEIRYSSPGEFSEKESLSLAEYLLDAYDGKNDKLKFDIRETSGKVAFDRQELCEVFSDGGWKVMSREYDEYDYVKDKEKKEYIFNYGLTQITRLLFY